MAIEFKNNPALAQLQIGDVVYYLKDAEVRAVLDAEIAKLMSAAYRNAADAVAATDDLVSGNAVIAYVENEVAELAKALTFEGVSETDPATGVVTINGEVLIPTKADVVLYGNKEYVYDGANWVELGDEGLYLTKNDAAATYLSKADFKTWTDAFDAWKATLKALAFKDTASGTVETVDAVTAAAHTPAGEVDVTLKHTATNIASTGKLTPAGAVTGKTTAAGSVGIARDDNGFEVTGSVTAPAIDVKVETAAVQHIASLGTLPTYKAAAYTAPSVKETSGNFATAGMVASVSGETLVLSAAALGAALTGTGFNAGSYTAAEFNAGSLPAFGEAQNVVVGATATATAPTFKADKIAATFTGAEAEINATFAGAEASVEVTGSYDKAAVETATFTGETYTPEITVTKTAKTITVQ